LIQHVEIVEPSVEKKPSSEQRGYAPFEVNHHGIFRTAHAHDFHRDFQWVPARNPSGFTLTPDHHNNPFMGM
jgi:hypothetical protein